MHSISASRFSIRRAVPGLIAVLFFLAAFPAKAQYTESLLTGFGGTGGGVFPTGSLILDSKGNLYGTTQDGGEHDDGLVFELSPPIGSGTAWTLTPLYSFGGDPDGLEPESNLIFDSSGNLYGTTFAGGTKNLGTVFKLSPPSSGSGPWTETILYSFCIETNCTDGEYLYAGLTLDSKGNLYGTTGSGGAYSLTSNGGTVFELSGSGHKVLWSFGGTSSDGTVPGSTLVFDSQGNLYGTTVYGGAYNNGTVFELSPSGSAWTEKVLYSFGDTPNDGAQPYAGVVFDSKGNLYGTTYTGGAAAFGTVFELSPSGTAWTEKVLWYFTDTPDGATPYAGVTFDARGNLYGTTYYGGTHQNADGAVFELSPPTSGSAWTESLPWSFGASSTDGTNPYGGVILDTRGNLYGTTNYNGPNEVGMVFELATTLPATSTTLVSSVNPSTPGESVTFTATVSPAGPPVPSGSVTFTSNGTAITGCATVTLSSSRTATCTTSALPTGTNTIIAAYSGNSSYAPSSATISQVVRLPATTTVVTSSQNPSTVGESVTLTATVTGLSPTGTVGFTSNGATISGCGSVTLSSGVAACTTTFVTKGSYSIVATYSGNGSNAGSSGSLTQVVGATSTTVTSSQNPSTSGGSVILTATVAPTGPPTPTGMVAFTSLGTPISGCSAITLSSSRTAACTTSALAVGTDAIVATYSGDSNYLSSNGTLTQLVNPIPTAVQLVPVTPCRVVDTREADGPFGGPAISGGSSRNFTIPSGPCSGIPSTAVAYSLNVTVVPPGPLGYLTIWPAGEGQPTVSTLNSLDGRIKANAAIVPAGTSGAVSVYVNNTSNVLLDINGYFAASSSSSLEFYPLTPCRVADTRGATGPFGGPALVANKERDFPVQSSTCKLPGTAQAYSLNFTVIPPATGDAVGYLTVWPEGETQPVVSTLNDPKGTIVANAALVEAGTPNGGVAVLANDATNLLIDVNGYFAAPGTGGYNLYTLTPCRVLDTRSSSGAFTNELTVNVSGSACAPSSADKAYVFNATVLPSGDLGYLTLWPDGETQPVVSTLNAADGAITSNMAIVPNTDGKTDAYASGTTQLIMDISAYFAPQEAATGHAAVWTAVVRESQPGGDGP